MTPYQYFGLDRLSWAGITLKTLAQDFFHFGCNHSVTRRVCRLFYDSSGQGQLLTEVYLANIFIELYC